MQQYLDTRYIAPYEAAYRIFKYKIFGQCRGPARAPPGGTGGLLRAQKPREGAGQHQAHEARGQLLAERMLPQERRLRYPYVPLHYTWNGKERRWDPRLQLPHAEIITRMVQVSTREVERHSLRELLLRIRDATSFEDMKRPRSATPATRNTPTGHCTNW